MIQRRFLEIGGLPQVVGCIDGTLLRIQAPTIYEHQFVDRHGAHSINLSAICGPDMVFYWVSCQFPGSVHDSRVFRESALYQRLRANNLLPPNIVLLGDSAYRSEVIFDTSITTGIFFLIFFVLDVSFNPGNTESK